MGLKDQLAALRVQAETKAAVARQADERKKAEQAAKDRAEAHTIFSTIPEMAEKAIAAGERCIQLYSHESVAPHVSDLTGVARILFDLLADEDLAAKVWVDMDCSGNFVVRNTLILNL